MNAGFISFVVMLLLIVLLFGSTMTNSNIPMTGKAVIVAIFISPIIFSLIKKPTKKEE